MTTRSGRRGSRLLAWALHLAARSPIARLASAGHSRIYERSGGRVLGRWFGNPVLVIETVGRRSGRRRRTPIAFVPRGGAYVVMPINAGSADTPAWWLNLEAAGRAVAITGGRRTAVTPRIAAGRERDELWMAYTDQAPAMLTYAEMTERDVPVVVLEPVNRGRLPV